MDQPTLIVIGGANGSGKTTLAREYISVENLPYLGADQIAYELNPENVESVAIEAGRLFIRKIEDSINKIRIIYPRINIVRAEPSQVAVKSSRRRILHDYSFCISGFSRSLYRAGRHTSRKRWSSCA